MQAHVEALTTCSICDPLIQQNRMLEDDKAALADKLDHAERDNRRLRIVLERARARAIDTLPADDGLKILSILRSFDE